MPGGDTMEWYPTPSYLLKRKVILDLLAGIPCGRFLEVGCGAGDLLAELERRGYEGEGIDVSPEAVAAARHRLLRGRVAVQQLPVEEVHGEFDVVIASEVLEHHPDDSAFLRTLVVRLKPGGRLVITVPAHMAKWGANDDLCGHVRRYERQELREKLQAAGLEGVQVWSYGVPLYNIMKPWYDRAVAHRISADQTAEERTLRSGGMQLPDRGGVYRLLFNDVTMAPFYLLQKLFFRSDFGNGYAALATRPKG